MELWLQVETDRLLALYDFAQKHREICNAHTVDFFTECSWDRLIPEGWKSELLSDDLKDNQVMFLNPEMMRESALKDFLSIAKQLKLPLSEMLANKDSNGVSPIDRFGMTEKKAHEVKRMATQVHSIARSMRINQVIDIGSGKGYLSEYLSFVHGFGVYGIDSSSINREGALDRSRKVNKYFGKFRRQSPPLVEGLLDRQTQDSVIPTMAENSIDKHHQCLDKVSLSDCVLQSDSVDVQPLSMHQNVPLSTDAIPMHQNVPLSTDAIPMHQNVPLSTDAVPMHQNVPLSTDAVPMHQNVPLSTDAVPMHQNVPLSTDAIPIHQNVEEAVVCCGKHYHQSSDSIPHCTTGAMDDKDSYNGTDRLDAAIVNRKDCQQSSDLPDNCSMCSDVNTRAQSEVSSISGFFKPLTHYIDQTDNNILGLIHDSSDDIRPSILVGLHTCGDLATTGLKQFVNSDLIRAVCIVGCCYHHITETGDCPGFPMSECLQSRGASLGRKARMLSCQSEGRFSTVTSGSSLMSVFYRAVLQVIFRDEMKMFKTIEEGTTLCVGRIKKYSNFVEYCRKAMKKLNIPANNQPSDDMLERFHDKYYPRMMHVQRYLQIRAVIAPVIESLIIIDRFLYLKEQKNVERAWIVQMFSPSLSPRCVGLCAYK